MLIRIKNLRLFENEKGMVFVMSSLNLKATDALNHLNLIMKLYPVSKKMTVYVHHISKIIFLSSSYTSKKNMHIEMLEVTNTNTISDSLFLNIGVSVLKDIINYHAKVKI